jgi:hypothetical protein
MSLRKTKRKKDERGQAILEFLVVVSLLFTIMFLFVQLAWGIAYGHFVHYATFMASRAYLSAGAVKSEQAAAAGDVLRGMLKVGVGKDILPFVAKARTGGDRDAQGPEPVPGAMVGTHPEAEGREHSRAYSWAEGVQYNYNFELFLLPIASFAKNDGQGKMIQGGTSDNPTKGIEWKGKIPMASDSFLGREPTVDECWKEMATMPARNGIPRGDGADFIEDNGC